MYHDVLMSVNKHSHSRFIVGVIMLGLRKQILPQDLLIIEIFTLIEETFIRNCAFQTFYYNLASTRSRTPQR